MVAPYSWSLHDHGGTSIRHQLNDVSHGGKLWEPGHVSVGDLWRLYAEYPYMPRLRDRRVLEDGLTGPQLLWEADGFALADGVDGDGRYRGLVLPADGVRAAITDSTLIVRPEAAKAQREAELTAAAASAGSDAPEVSVLSDGAGAAIGVAPAGVGSAPMAAPAKPSKIRYFGSKQIDVSRFGSEVKKLNDEILAPLLAVDGAAVTVTIEIEAVNMDGFDDAKVRTVSENAATLKFEQTGFEEG